MSLPQLLTKAAARAGCDGVLLSGGLDSTTVAWALVSAGIRPLALHVQLASSPGTDLPYALDAARVLRLPLAVYWAGEEEALRAVDEAVGILKTFNPMEVVNCAAVYLGVELAARLGVRRLCTGDGGDELFAGYSYMAKMPPDKLNEYIWRLVKKWRFCSFDVGRKLGVEIHAPYLHEEVIQYALLVPAVEKVKDGIGKHIVRRQFDGILPKDLVWRRKDPIEVGTGFKALYHTLSRMAEAIQTDIPAPGAARYLYAVFRRRGLSYEKDSLNPCPVCGYRLEDGYCHMCGHHSQ